ncbi:hypothetical protein ACOSQ2_012427 [Xanthoceras sorbifolium]
MLNYGVTLPLQPFIARFVDDINLAPAQLAPNSYRTLLALYTLWHRLGYSDPSPREIRYCYKFRPYGAGSYYLVSFNSVQWFPVGEDGRRLSGRFDIAGEGK